MLAAKFGFATSVQTVLITAERHRSQISYSEITTTYSRLAIKVPDVRTSSFMTVNHVRI
ncbi:MAG: hypothetical protein MR555_01205 [Spirochaetia bacterium]|nr:hypothetical protein [Spirochaetia bacterium]